MKIPRDINAQEFINLLSKKLGYIITRQVGSHIRLSSSKYNHNVTIPNHKPIRVGTLNNIIKDISESCGIEKLELIRILFN